jgi:hypothetical protein
MAVTVAEVGYTNLATRLVNTAPESGLSSTDRALAAIALASAGDSKAAQEIIEKLKKQYPLDTMVNYGVQTAGAAIELSHDNAERALLLLEPTAHIEYSILWGMQAAYIRGLANLQLRKGEEAAADFQEILDHRGIVVNNVWGALAHLGLARRT